MREYRYQMTEASIEAVRRLMRPWVSMAATDRQIAITTTESGVVVLSVESADVAGVLEVSRLRADVIPTDEVTRLEQVRDMPLHDLGRGRNDVVLFAGESWVEGAPGGGRGDGARSEQTMQFSGRAGQRPDTATVVCTTTDAIVVAASTGEGVLIQIGIRPSTLDIVHDRAAIASFLVQRGYASDDASGT